MPEIKLRVLLESVNRGEVVLPDFQRDFVWYPEDVRELLVSVIGDYFIGSILWMETTKESSPFALRLVEGVEKVNPDVKIQNLVKVVLDGQQRITSLYYAFYQPEIPLRSTKNPYRYYLDIDKALSGEYDEAVKGVSTYFKNEIKKIEKDPNIISFSDFLDFKKLAKKYSQDERFTEIIDLVNRILDRYEINVVPLKFHENDLEKVVETFERINRTGLPLSVFDLMTAKLYNYKINLRDLLKDAENKFDFTKFVKPEFILKVMALIRDQEPKRKSILNLSPQNFEEDWIAACEALKLAFRRVKSWYGVLDFENLMPYTTMLVPLAGMIHFLKVNRLDRDENYRKLDVWYWAAVFAQRYDQAVDSKTFRDYKDFKDWVLKGKIPEFIEKFDPEEIDLDVESAYSAIHRGVICLIVVNGAYDFLTGQAPTFEREKIQIDHIFPRAHFNENRVLIKTIISTNQRKIDKKPSEYFEKLVKERGEDKVKEILKTHLIPPDTIGDLLNDNLEGFIEKRKQAIIEEIKKRTEVNN
jgi:hypothetical protein